MHDPTLIEITGWCRCLAIWEQNETYILYILHSSVQKPFSRHWANGGTRAGAQALGYINTLHSAI